MTTTLIDRSFFQKQKIKFFNKFTYKELKNNQTKSKEAYEKMNKTLGTNTIAILELNLRYLKMAMEQNH